MTRDLRLKTFSGPDAEQFKRHEHFRTFAEKVLGVHIVLTPSSEGIHISASKHIPDVGVTFNRACYFVTHHEINDCVLDVVALNMVQAVKDVGGFDVLH